MGGSDIWRRAIEDFRDSKVMTKGIVAKEFAPVAVTDRYASIELGDGQLETSSDFILPPGERQRRIAVNAERRADAEALAAFKASEEGKRLIAEALLRTLHTPNALQLRKMVLEPSSSLSGLATTSLTLR